MSLTFHADTLFNISNYLPTRCLFTLRLVSTSWNNYITSNGIWKELFIRDFGTIDWLINRWNLNISITRYQDTTLQNYITLQQLEKELKDNLWFILYQSVVLSIPLQFNINSKEDKESDDEEESDVEEKKKNKKKRKKKEDKKNKKKKKKFDDFIKEDEIVQKDSDTEGEDYEENPVVTIMHYYFKVHLHKLYQLFTSNIVSDKQLLIDLKDALVCDRKIHKLSSLFSIFDKNGLQLRFLGPTGNFKLNTLPKLTEKEKENKTAKLSFGPNVEDQAAPRIDIQGECSNLMIGYSHDYDIITISKFSYAMLCGKEDLLFARKDSTIEQVNYGDCKELITIGVSPYIEGPFTPFCYYLQMDLYYGLQEDANYFEDSEELMKNGLFLFWNNKTSKTKKKKVEVLDDNMFGNFNPDHYSSYSWKSNDQFSWCPGFWNASFSWIFKVSFDTEWRDEMEMLRVKQTQIAQLC
ncbi:hypothetical protein ABK040_006693 [Willaertia magna]